MHASREMFNRQRKRQGSKLDPRLEAQKGQAYLGVSHPERPVRKFSDCEYECGDESHQVGAVAFV